MSRALAFLILPLAACIPESSVDEHVFEEPVTSVRVEADSADVDIVAVDGLHGARVVSRTRWQKAPPIVRVEVVGGELRVAADCDIRLTIGTSCDVDLVLEVPTAADVHSALASGDVTVDGVTGAVALSAGSGDVRLKAVSGAVSIETGSGDVTGRDLDVDTLDVTVGSGDIAVSLATAPTSAWLEASSGDIELSVPRGAYDLATSTSSGDISVDGVGEDASAPSRLDLHTRSGDITLVGR